MTSSGAVLVDTVEDGVVRITLNRPDLLNAIDGSLLDGVDAALDAAVSGEPSRLGLVHEVVPDDRRLDASLAMARQVVANNPFGVWQTKIGLNAALDAPSLRHAKEIENRTQILTGFTNNPAEAAKARL